MKLAALYWQHQEHLKDYPQEVFEMRSRLRSLDFEVSPLKSLEPEVHSLHSLLSESQQRVGLAEAQVMEWDQKILMLEQQVCELSNAETRRAREISNLQAQLDASEVVISSLEVNQVLLRAEKHMDETEKEELEDELKATTQLFQEAESVIERLKKKLSYYKVRVARYVKQLSFLPWLRDHSWTRDFNWGFESFRTLTLNPTIFKHKLSCMRASFLPILDKATIELYYIGEELFPNAQRWDILWTGICLLFLRTFQNLISIPMKILHVIRFLFFVSISYTLWIFI